MVQIRLENKPIIPRRRTLDTQDNKKSIQLPHFTLLRAFLRAYCSIPPKKAAL